MTVIVCPHGCGGTVDTAIQLSCPSCRRGLNESETILAEDAVKIDTFWGKEYPDVSPVQRKLSWCWEWFGPSNHRMRCRLPKGHSKDHFDHEEQENHETVAIDGEVISVGLGR